MNTMVTTPVLQPETAPARRAWETPVITPIDVAESTESGFPIVGTEIGPYGS